MSSLPILRRTIAQRMDLWAGDPNGSGGPSTFTSVDSQGSLTVLYDNTRPEETTEFNGAWICINPAGSGNPALATVWRKLSDDDGFIQPNGLITLTSAVPSSAYAGIGMTYELYKVFRPEQWMIACNWALSNAFPGRHRRVAFEVPEDPTTTFYDWANIASRSAIPDPANAPNAGGGPVVTAYTVPTGSYSLTYPPLFPAGTYNVAYTFFNSVGETKPSPSAQIVMLAGQAIRWASFTVPETAVGMKFYVTRDGANPSAALFSELTWGQGVLSAPPTSGQLPRVGYAGPDFSVADCFFLHTPNAGNSPPPLVNTTAADVSEIATIRRRINPGQYPEVFVDLNPQWWRPNGGTTIKLEYRPVGQYNLRFECYAPVIGFTQESDTTQEPTEMIITGGEYYLWDTLLKTATSQNASAWATIAKESLAKYMKLVGQYSLETPRRTVRRPHITPVW